MNTGYQPEPYWSDVARRIGSRKGSNVIAGDDEPYYRYKRQRFVQLLRTLDLKGMHVLEVGCGPGGNLLEISTMQPASLAGADISAEMIELAQRRLESSRIPVELVKVDGLNLPFPDDSFDRVFTATVLQHNTDEHMLRRILSEICRVSAGKVILMERVEKKRKGDELCMGRPVGEYREICAGNGFQLDTVRFINTRVSYLVSGAIRKLFNKAGRREGETVSRLSVILQKLTLPLTRLLDRVFNSPTDVAMMVFSKTG
jgi:ubiquinone/menaquinone biosynthesis C-methylase UbiE